MNETERKEIIEEIVKEIVPVILEKLKEEIGKEKDTQQAAAKPDYKQLVMNAMK